MSRARKFVLVFYVAVTNYYKFGNLKQYKCIIL